MLGFLGPEWVGSDLQKFHEREGARIARELLASEGFPRERIEEIAGIIAGHDTRERSISLNDELVKDADKLFRMTPEGFHMMTSRFKLPEKDLLKWYERRVESWFFTAAAKRIALKEFKDRKRELAI